MSDELRLRPAIQVGYSLEKDEELPPFYGHYNCRCWLSMGIVEEAGRRADDLPNELQVLSGVSIDDDSLPA